MTEPAYVLPASCPTCRPWVRLVPTPTGALARQELHEPHCVVVPRLQKVGTYYAEAGNA